MTLTGWDQAAISASLRMDLYGSCMERQRRWVQAGGHFLLHLSPPAELRPGKISICETLCDRGVGVKGTLKQCTALSVIKRLFGKEYEGPEIPGSFQGVKPIDSVCP